MNKQDVINLIKEKNLWHEITEHEAVFNMEELSKVEVPYPENDAKNLFVRDDKKTNYYLITVKGDKRVDLKEFRRAHDTRHLSFASADDLNSILSLIPGSVSPFGLLNDSDLKAQFFIDQDFLDDVNIIGVHPNDNTATIWLRPNDLIDIVKSHGNKVTVIEI